MRSGAHGGGRERLWAETALSRVIGTASLPVLLAGQLGHAAAVWLHPVAPGWMPAPAFAIYLGLMPAFALAGGTWPLGDPVSPAQFAGGAPVVFSAVLPSRSIPMETPS